MRKSKTEIIKELVGVAGADGTWNYDPYLMGMYNGLELALSVLEDRSPKYKEKPDKWISHKIPTIIAGLKRLSAVRKSGVSS